MLLYNEKKKMLDTGPVETNLQSEPHWDGGTKVCSNCPSHMTKMAAMSIYGKTVQKSFSPELVDRLP